ncbi:MAG: hypothetical protein KA369_16920 [Spirochaetes bacterium]|nr:hypothetical protein [Spirochaetota bacterium]
MIKKCDLLSTTVIKVCCVVAPLIIIGAGSALFLCTHDLNILSDGKVPWWLAALFFAGVAGIWLCAFPCCMLALSYLRRIRDKKSFAIEAEIQKSIELCEAILGGAIAVRPSGKSVFDLSLYNALVARDPGLPAGEAGELFRCNMGRVLALLVDVERRFAELEKMGKDPSAIFGHGYCRHLMTVMKSWIARQRGNCVLDTYDSFGDILKYFEVNV